MTSSTTCCLNLLPPSQDSNSISSPITRTSLLPRQDEQRSWRTKCLVSMVCTAVGLLETANLVMCNESYTVSNVGTKSSVLEHYVESNKAVAPRWSDKRSCPPWEMNSLEIIVPENLPRPSAHRKSESVGFSKAVATAKMNVKRKTNCFST